MMNQQPNGYQPLMANQGVPSFNNASNPQNYYAQGGAPQIMYAQNNSHYALGSGLQKLEHLNGIFVKKQLELAEVLLGCETRNRYHVYGLDDVGKKKEPLHFKCKENSNWCERQCLAANCRPFQMDVSTLQTQGERDALAPFLSLSRPCKCTFYCLARPELRVNLVENGENIYLGKVTEPFRCCNMEQHIFDKEDNHKFSIFGSCSQLGVWCKLPCDACQTIDFEIRSASGEVIGHVQKRSQGCIKAAISDTDIFTIKYPQVSSATDKALLMSAVLFLDYNYFEKNPNENNQQNL